MENKEAASELKYIRSMIERASGFRAINGWGVMAVGVVALAAAWVAGRLFAGGGALYGDTSRLLAHRTQVAVAGALVLVVVCGLTVYLSSMWLARRRGIPFAFDGAMRRLVFSFSLPLLTGGLFCLALVLQGHYGLTSSVMLLFYGMALVNCHHFSHPLLGVLGCLELLLGLADCFVSTHALLFWALGFGVLHLLFGLLLVVGGRKR